MKSGTGWRYAERATSSSTTEVVARGVLASIPWWRRLLAQFLHLWGHDWVPFIDMDTDDVAWACWVCGDPLKP